MATTPVVPAPAPAPAPAPHVSWLKKLGHFLGVIIGVVAKDVKPVEEIAVPVLKQLFPGLAGLITAGDSLLSKIVMQALAAETTIQSVAGATGPQKLAAVLSSVTTDIDQWIANAFPGAAQLADAEKANLISAIVAILNKLGLTELVPTPPTAPTAPTAGPAGS